MNKLWLVAQYEYKRHVLKRSFLFALLSVPLVVILLLGINRIGSILQKSTSIAVGYIDGAGLFPEPLTTPTDEDAKLHIHWRAFPTEEAARQSLEAEDIPAYYVLPADYLTGGRVELVYYEEPGSEITRQFQDLLRVHLLAGWPAEIAQRALAGSELTVRLSDGSPGGPREFSGDPSLGQLLPALSGLVLVILIFFSSGYLLQAVIEEKSNRTMEILSTSLSSTQLMVGKVLSTVGVSLTQLIGWIVLAGLAISVGGHYLGLEWLQDLHLDPKTSTITLALLLPSYVMVAALMTTVGAILVEARAGQQITAGIISFYMVPLGFIGPMLHNLGSPLAVGMSLFPLTSPVVLPLRVTFSQVPAWQIAVSLVIQIVCAGGALWLAGRALRLGMLRYGRPLKLGELFGRVVPQAPAQVQRDRREHHREGRAARAVGGNKVLLVLRHELITTITRKSFLALCVGLPLLLFVQMLGFEAMSPNTSPSAGSGTGDAGETVQTLPGPLAEIQGYVDPSGLIQFIPDNVPAGLLQPYDDETAAQQALDAGQISAYYLVPTDYVESGRLVTVRPDYAPFSPDEPAGWMRWVLLVNLLEGDLHLAAYVWNPLPALQPTALTPATTTPAEEEQSNPVVDTPLPMMIMLLQYGVIIMASSLLLNSVSDEKKNRVIELLLVSVHPRQMLLGKTIALGIAGLIQALAWGVLEILLLGLTGRTFDLPVGVEIPPSVLGWGLLLFLLGYALYASLMAGVGALVPNIKESPQASLVIALPALIGFQISLFTTHNPHGALSTGASLFPLTAPFSMIPRLVIGGVPLWQLLLAAGLLLLSAYIAHRAVASMFQAQNLLSGQPFKPGRFFKALLGKTES